MKDPAAVAAAYGQALKALDGDAALPLLALTPDNQAMLKAMFQEFAKGPGGMDGRTFVRQFILVPIFGMGDYVAGKADVKGDRAVVPVEYQATMSLKFVLLKQPDGAWKLDLDETSKATTGRPLFFLHQGGMDGGGDDGGAAGPNGTVCLSNLRQLGLAAMMFAQDHDEMLPSADKWTDELKPYIKNDKVFVDPETPELPCGYAINAKIAGKSLADIAEPATTVLFFDSATGKPNTADAMTSVPPKGRHNGGSNFAYADGHVRWVKAGANPEEAAPMPLEARGQMSAQTCQNHLRALAAAALQFAKDHNDTLPTANKWADELKAYVKDDAVFHCTNEAGLPGAYALNAKVAGKALADILEPGKTVLFFESNSDKPSATDPLDTLVPEGRHNGGNEFAYCDGHVQWVRVGDKP
jgi:prepilin-type processing-associated H-X9-DG protein